MNLDRTVILLAACFLALLAPPVCAQEGCQWMPGFEASGPDSAVFALASYDDGGGPALYAGGDFTTASGTIVNRIAKWDGSTWSPISGPLDTGTNHRVNALAVYDNGSGPALYAGGSFTFTGGVTVNHVAKWDGSAWSVLDGPLGTGTNGTVNALAVYDDGSGPALYAGGVFTSAGGVTVNRIARWDGGSWSALSGPAGTGTDLHVAALAVHDDGSGPALYAGGDFTAAGGVTVNHVAKWDGSAWSALSGPAGPGTDGDVEALVAHDDGSGPALYAGGDFTIAGGVTVNKIAKWDGSAWSALSGPAGTGTNREVEALVVHDDGGGPALFAGGSFTTAGGVTVHRIAKWDGSAWSTLGGSGGSGLDGGLWALVVHDDGGGGGPALYVGGSVTTAGGVTVDRIAKWDGAAWSGLGGPVGHGLNDTVDALAVYDGGSGPALYVGGWFTGADGVTVNGIAKWGGSAWSALSGPAGTGTKRGGIFTCCSGYVEALAVYDGDGGPALYAGGGFTTAGGVTVNGIAKWDGSAWSALSGPAGTGISNNTVRALAVYDDGGGPALYAGGWFTAAGGVTVNGIAKWDGSAWSTLSGPQGTGVNAWVNALAVYDDGGGPALYAGGSFTSAGGVTVNHVAKWDGNAWSALSGPQGTGTDGPFVNALAVYDDGGGPALYAIGGFDTAGGVTVNHVAKWDGDAWSALSGPAGTGIQSWGFALAVHGDGGGPALYASGVFETAGGVTVNRIAKWDGSAWSALNGPAGTGIRNGFVLSLAAHDDGSGPALYAGGSFSIVGGLVSNFIGEYRCPPIDLGDAPDPGYPTYTASDGARHQIAAGLHLGAGVDADGGGQSDADAEGDDGDGNDDEDGVVFTSQLIPGRTATADVTASQAGLLDAWIDWNGDGDWTDAGERIFSGEPLAAGTNALTFDVAADASPNIRTFARFRFSSAGVEAPIGRAPDGEVEDHAVSIARAPFVCSGDRAFITQDPRQVEVLPETAKDNYLYVVDQSVRPYHFEFVARLESPPGTPIVVNNLGYRSTDGLLYGWRRSPLPREMIVIDAGGAVTGLGPAGLPEEEAFLAGEVAADGREMYFLSVATITDDPQLMLYTVPLPVASGPTTATGIWGDGIPVSSDDRNQNVGDWAVNPADGLLYGADREGQLARLDPATGQRTDQAIPGLPAGKGYGAAWFNAAGRLVLYWNAGEVFEIAVSETPTIVDSYPESACKRNDGASCTAG